MIPTKTVSTLRDYQNRKKHSNSQLKNPLPSDGAIGDAVVLPFTRKTDFLAVLELDDCLSYRMVYSEVELQYIFGRISNLLTREFGRGVVRRERSCFTLGHNQFESLVAGLLRVQFYANMEDLPEFNIFGERSNQEGMSLTWGIGKDTEDAEHDLSRKKRQKEARRQKRAQKRQR